MRDSGDHAVVCSQLLPANGAVVMAGARVKVAHVTLYTGHGNGFDMLILYPLDTLS